MNIFKSAIATVVLLSSVSYTANAADSARSFGDVYADCGLGAMIFSRDTDNDRVLAMISNITWDLGTTAHSSNLSSAENCKTRSATSALFIMDNLPQIEGDIARGEGDHLAAAVSTMGCDSTLSSVTDALRAEVSASVGTGVYAEMDAKQKSAQIFDSISTSCTI